MKVLGQLEEIKFIKHDHFEPRFLRPIGAYVNWKLEYQWDDYNELYHAIKFIQGLENQDDIWLDVHTMEKDNLIVGTLLVVGGEMHENRFDGLNNKTTIRLKYFHIMEKGNGYGSHWLQKIIFPHYKKTGFKHALVGSSHPKSFPFYSKLGKEWRSTRKPSDNNIFTRIVKQFLITI